MAGMLPSIFSQIIIIFREEKKRQKCQNILLYCCHSVLSAIFNTHTLYLSFTLFNSRSSVPLTSFLLIMMYFCLSQVLSVLLSPLERLGWGVCWCWVCVECMRQQRAVHCSVVGCTALYCAQCWRDLGNCCFCTFSKDRGPQDSDSDIDTVYYVY